MLKLKLQYFGHLMRTVDSLEKTDAGRDWGQEEKGMTEGWDGWMASLTRWTWVWVNSGSWWWTGRPGVLWFMGSQRVGHNWATDLISWEISSESSVTCLANGSLLSMHLVCISCPTTVVVGLLLKFLKSLSSYWNNSLKTDFLSLWLVINWIEMFVTWIQAPRVSTFFGF